MRFVGGPMHGKEVPPELELRHRHMARIAYDDEGNARCLGQWVETYADVVLVGFASPDRYVQYHWFVAPGRELVPYLAHGALNEEVRVALAWRVLSRAHQP